MKRIFITIVSCFLLNGSLVAQPEYFYPKGTSFNREITPPWDHLGYQIGDFHTRVDQVVSYFQTLAKESERASFQIIGYTNERRPQIVLTLTSPANHQQLEQLRQDHLKIADPGQNPGDLNNSPAIIHLGYNVHGNEPSSTEAAILTAYYLTASTNQEVINYLQNAVIHIDPLYNPDGRDRHTTWVNAHRGFPPVAENLDREHTEAWPGGRTNHYWFDLNRDWLPLVHVESRNRIEFYHRWLPNVATDFHEMGSNSTYFFEPTKPFGSENPVVPRSNYQEFNNLFAKYFSEALDEIGSLYWSREVFDNSYPGYGSTYPDIHGGLGLVFEQASSRGHLQQHSTGEISFAFSIRNHLRTSIATVKAGVENKSFMHNHLRQFFTSALDEARKSNIKGYVFGDSRDQGKTRAFLDLLLRHRIVVHELSEAVSSAGNQFVPGSSYLVPVNQKQYRMVRTMFEKVTSFADSVFYDASAWSMALGYGIPHGPVTSSNLPLGATVSSDQVTIPDVKVNKASYAYLVSPEDYFTHRTLYFLLKNEVNVKVAFKSFTTRNGASFPNGTLLIAVKDQRVTEDELYQLIQETAGLDGISVESVSTGWNVSGIDLGSTNFRTVQMPKPLMLIGRGISSYEAGEIWHLLDTRVGFPIAKVDLQNFNQVNLSDYNQLILVSGSYSSIADKQVEEIKDWIANGGTVIAQRTAVQWLIRKELTAEKLPDEDEEDPSNPRMDFITASDFFGARQIGGSFYQADLDVTNPLGFGYQSRTIILYKNNRVFLQPSKNPFATAAKYTASPLISGYVHPDNLRKISNAAAILISRQGSGRLILFADNPNFRGFMYGTSKLFLNALFYGQLINLPN